MSDSEKLQISGFILAIIFGIQQIIPDNPELGIGNLKISLHVYSEIGLILSGSFFLAFAILKGAEHSKLLRIPHVEKISELTFTAGIFFSIVAFLLSILIQVTVYTLTRLSGLPLVQKIAGSVLLAVITLSGILLNAVIEIEN